MGWSTQAAVVSGGVLQLPAGALQQSNVPNLTAETIGGNVCALVMSGPGTAAAGYKAWTGLQFWSDTQTGASHQQYPNGAHMRFVYVDTSGVANILAAMDISGLLISPGASGAPGTPGAGCYLFYAGGVLWAKGTSGTAVALATT